MIIYLRTVYQSVIWDNHQGLLYGYADRIRYRSKDNKMCMTCGRHIKDRHESIKCYCMTGIDLCMEYGIT